MRRRLAGARRGPPAGSRSRALVVAAIGVAELASGGGSTATGRAAPPLPAKALRPPAVDLAALRGKPALVDFFASWCEPCAEEAPTLRKLSASLGGRATVVAVDWDDAGGAARAFVRKHGWDFPVLADTSGSGGRKLRPGRAADLLRARPAGPHRRHLPRPAERGDAPPGAPRSRLSAPRSRPPPKSLQAPHQWAGRPEHRAGDVLQDQRLMQLRKDDMTHVSTRPVALRMIVGAAAVVAALLAFVPAASAARDPISGGTTDLHLKKGFVKKLTNLGVGLAGVGTGQVSGNAISLPVTEGMFDPTNAQGHITSPGGFQLVKGARSVAITDVEANTVQGYVRANDRRRENAARHLRQPDRRPRRLRRAGQGGPADADPEGREPDLQQTRPAGLASGSTRG